jgi:tetratricopeptide (TPR) repeat protein
MGSESHHPDMSKSVIQQAVEGNDPELARQALHQIDLLVQSSSDSNDKVYLLFSKASCYGILRDFVEARRQLDYALRQRPDDVHTQVTFQFMQGLLSQQEGNYSEALEKFGRTLSTYSQQLRGSELHFMYEDIQQRRAFLSVTLSKFEDAIPLLNEVLSFVLSKELRSDALASLGLCYFGLKNHELTRDYFIQAVAAGLTQEWEGKAHYYLGIAYFHTDMIREAKEEFLLCEHLATVHQLPMVDIYAWLSATYKRLGKNSESEHYAALKNRN